MGIPRNLKIGAHVYSINMNPVASLDGMICLGKHSGSLEIIEIHPGYPEGTQEAALVHEIIEALNWQNELNMDHHVISCISEGIYQVLKDNGLQFGRERSR